MLTAKNGQGFYDATVDIIDDKILEYCDRWIEFMRPFLGDFIGTVHGHHFHNFSARGVNTEHLRKVNSDEYICAKLQCKYFGDIGKIKLVFKELRTEHVILLHHGFGGGKMFSGPKINKRENAHRGQRVDTVLMGHDNSRLASCNVILDWDRPVEQRSVGTGAYEMAYKEGQAHNGYVEEALMIPSAIGSTAILFENWKDTLRVRALV